MLTSVNMHTVINKMLFSVKRIFTGVLYFIDSHFTYLSILLIGIIGSIIFFSVGYMCRYNKYDFWRWKSRALFRSIRLCLILVSLKGAIQVLK